MTKTIKKLPTTAKGKTPVYNLKAEIVSNITLPKNVFGVKISEKLINNAVRIYLSNQRSSHAKVKDRGEVAGTTKKMWAQKGTGRARHGSAKAPQFIGGGVAHGPQGNQTFKLKLNKKVKKLVSAQILSKFAVNGSIIIVDDFKTLVPKTKEAWNFMDLLEKTSKIVNTSRKIAIITSIRQDNVTRAFQNIPGFKLMSLQSLNPLALSNQNLLIFSQSAIEDLAKKYE